MTDLGALPSNAPIAADGIADADKLGLSGASVRRGKSIIAAEGTRTNVAYGALSDGPDQVSGVVLPTNGLIFLAFSGMFKSSVNGAGHAAIFIGANQLKAPFSGAAAPAVNEAPTGGTNFYYPLYSSSGLSVANGLEFTGHVTTGEVVGSVVPVFAAAGTYDISVQFKATSGSVTAKERKLWVWTMAF